MAAKRITVVGAGLAGMTAAINLAREGWEVTVLDKEIRHGGRPEFRPDGAASPFDFRAVESYTGIDISPACRSFDLEVTSIFGQRIEAEHREGSQTYMVERGSRSTSIDSLLHGLAVDAGVGFEWGRAIKSPADVAGLPEGSIIATGLDVQGFEAMGIPYVPFWGWYAKGKVDDDRTLAFAYVDDFTVDYAFTTVINGIGFALLFQREKPMLAADKEKFTRYTDREGLGLAGWSDLIGGAAPHRTVYNPVLYKNNMIVAGTLSGVMEPMMNFGMLGALISGKIAAVAVTDRGRAYEEWRRLTSFFKKSMMVKHVHDHLPLPARRALWGTAAKLLSRATPEQANKGMRFVPGYGGFDRPPVV